MWFTVKYVLFIALQPQERLEMGFAVEVMEKHKTIVVTCIKQQRRNGNPAAIIQNYNVSSDTALLLL